MKKIKKWMVNQIVSPAKMGVLLFGIILSVLCLVASVAAACKLYFMGLNLVAVGCGSAGCFVSGVLFAYFIIRMLNLAEQFGGDKREDTGNLEKERDAAMQKCKSLETDIENLRNDNERLKGARIDITSIKSVLEIVLAEVDMRIKDVCHKWLDGTFKPKTPWHRATIKKYLGVVEKTFKAKLGVDLKKVSVCELAGKRLIISGIKAQVTPCCPETKWINKEVITYKLRRVNDGETAIRFYDGVGYIPDESENILEASIDQRDVSEPSQNYDDELTKRIKSTDFENYSLAVKFAEKAAERFIEMILLPCKNNGFTIEFVSKSDSDSSGMLLVDFINNFNDRMGSLKLSNAAGKALINE